MVDKTDKFKKQAHVLMVHIHSLCQRKLGKCVATTKYLSELIGKSERQTYYYLKYLKDTKQIHVSSGEIKVDKRRYMSKKSIFYQNRIIQSYHQDPSGSKEINNSFFNKTELNIKNIEIKDDKLNDKLLDKTGAPLPPEKVGVVTKEFFEEHIKKFKAEKKEHQEKQEVIEEPKVFDSKIIEDFSDQINVSVSDMDEKEMYELFLKVICKERNQRTPKENKFIYDVRKREGMPTEPGEIVEEVKHVSKKIEPQEYIPEEPEEGNELEWLRKAKNLEKNKETKVEETRQFKARIDLKLKPFYGPR